MALPSGIATVTVTVGPYLSAGGTPANGRVRFVPEGQVLHTPSGSVILPDSATVDLVAGAGSVTLVASDAAGVVPNPFAYWVFWELQGATSPEPRRVMMPAATPTVDLDRDLLPTTSTTGTIATPAVTSVAGLAGTPTAQQLVTALDTPLRATFEPRRTVLAERHSRRIRAELDALLAETLPGATVGAPILDSAGSTITGGTFLAAITGSVISPTLRYTGAKIAQGSPYPYTLTVTDTGLNSTFGTLPFAVEFTYDGAAFEFDYAWRVVGPSFRVWADGVLVGSVLGPTGGTANGNFYNQRITLPDARRRQFRIEFSGGTNFGGLYIEPGKSVAYPAGTKGPRVILFGDSYVEGAGASTTYAALAYRLALALGWRDLWRSGSGGTGYLAVPVSPAGRKTLRQRVQTDVVDQAPNVVIIAAGINDRSFTAAAVGTEAEALYAVLATALPNTEFVVVGPWGPKDASLLPADTLAISAAVRAQAEARGWYFIDPIAETWITGGGYVGATTGGGNSDVFISADGTHPTDAGYAYLAGRLAGHLRILGAAGV